MLCGPTFRLDKRFRRPGDLAHGMLFSFRMMGMDENQLAR